MALIETWVKQDLKNLVQVRWLDGNLFSQDNGGNLIGVEVYNHGLPETLSGTVSAVVIRADGGTVPIESGTLDGNKASVVLPAAAYAIIGNITISIKLAYSSTVTTLACVSGIVYPTSTDTPIDPGTVMPSIEDLLEQIQTAVESIPADYSSLWHMLAPVYSADETYAVGQYRTYDGAMYRCKTAITQTEPFTPAHWEATNIGAELVAINDEIGNTVLPTTAQTLTGAIAEHETDLEAINDEIGNTVLPTTAQTLTGAIAEHETDLGAINGKIGDTVLPTTAQTLTGAIAEHETDIDGNQNKLNTIVPIIAKVAYTPSYSMVDGGINTTGGNMSSSSRTRTGYIPIKAGQTYLLILNSDDYKIMMAWTYTTQSPTATSRKVIDMGNHTVLFTAITDETHFRVSFAKTDDTQTITSEDKDAILAAIKISVLTDEQLVMTGCPADAKVVGDVTNDLKAEVDVLIADGYVAIPFTDAGSGYINSGTGALVSSETYDRTNYIDVSFCRRIRYKRTGHTASSISVGMAFYTEAKVYISGAGGQTSQSSNGYISELYELSVPANAKYARFTMFADTTTYGNFEIYGESAVANDIENLKDISSFALKEVASPAAWALGNWGTSSGAAGSNTKRIRTESGTIIDTDYIIISESDVSFYVSFYGANGYIGYNGAGVSYFNVAEFIKNNPSYASTTEIRLTAKTEPESNLTDLVDQTAAKIHFNKASIDFKLDKNQGANNSFKSMVVNTSGDIVPGSVKADAVEVPDSTSEVCKSIHDGADGLPVKSCHIQINPFQSGAGDPSPDNTRGIEGWTGISINQSHNVNLCGGDALKNILVGNTDSSRWYKDNRYYNLYGGSGAASKKYIKGGFKENTQYTFMLMLEKSAANSPNCRIYYSDGTYTGIGSLTTANTKELKVVTTDANKTVRAFRGTYSNGTSTKLYVDESGIFEGVHTAEEFVAYQGNAYDITFPTEAGTVYGGELTINEDGSGTLAVNTVYVEYDGSEDEMWYAETSTNRYFRTNVGNYGSIVTGGIISNIYKKVTITSSNTDIGIFANNSSGFNKAIITIRPEGYSSEMTVSDFKALLASQPVLAVYKITTPIEYTFTAAQMTTLLGTNNIWTETGNILSITYPADTKLYVDHKIEEKVSASKRLMELIVTANREDSMVATQAYTSGDLLIVNNTLYKASADIANGATLTVGTNVTATTVAAEIAALA